MGQTKRRLIFLMIICICIQMVFIVYVVKEKRHTWLTHFKDTLFPTSKQRQTTDSIIKQIVIRSRSSISNYSGSGVAFVRKEEWFLYPRFAIRPPRFASNRSRDLFYKGAVNVKRLMSVKPEELVGTIYHVTNGSYSLPHNCGYLSHLEHVMKPRNIKPDQWHSCLVPLIVPDAHAFQHFIDGVLPKVLQVKHVLLSEPRCKLVIFKPGTESIIDMLRALNISDSQLLFLPKETRKTMIGADNLVYSCNTPPLHPTLWRNARSMLGAKTELQVPVRQAYVIVVTRGGCYNCGRNVLNQGIMIDMLINRYGLPMVKVFNGPVPYNETLALFGQARIIMGPHGGGMYNVIYAPEHTAVIEFMPTYHTGEMAAASKVIIWAQASILGQDYWRIALPVVGESDMNVDLTELKHILEVLDRRD